MVAMMVVMVLIAAAMVMASSAVVIVVAVVIAPAMMVSMVVAAASAMVMAVVVVRSVDFEPVELVLLVLEEQGLIAFLFCHFGQDIDDLNQTEGVQSGVMLLTVSERSSLPIRHLLALAHLLIEQVFGHFGQT